MLKIPITGGTASYLLGMSSLIAAQSDGGNTPVNVKNLSLGWIIAFLFTVSFVGLFSIVPLRKVLLFFIEFLHLTLVNGVKWVVFHSLPLFEIHGFVLPQADDDHEVQTDVPQRNCHCFPHQQLPYP